MVSTPYESAVSRLGGKPDLGLVYFAPALLWCPFPSLVLYRLWGYDFCGGRPTPG